ncbi:MAG: phosphoribosyl-ATP diphosphatase, partial [Anaerolineae bacterium]
MNDWQVLEELWQVIQDRRQNPQEGSYTSRLFALGEDEVVKKVGEEAIEVIVAAKAGQPDAVVREAADLLYHLWVLLALCEVPPER